MTTVTPPEELIQGVTGRWLGRRGIFRHYQPSVEAVRADANSDETVCHTMSTVVEGEFAGKVVGELIRWVDAEEVTYEVRINGFDNLGGICDIAAYTLDDIASLAKVANDLRYEWCEIIGLHNRPWSVL